MALKKYEEWKKSLGDKKVIYMNLEMEEEEVQRRLDKFVQEAIDSAPALIEAAEKLGIEEDGFLYSQRLTNEIPAGYAIGGDKESEEIIREEIDKEILNAVKTVAEAKEAEERCIHCGGRMPSVFNYCPCGSRGSQCELEIESEEITKRPRKFSKVNHFTEGDWQKVKGIGAKLAKKLVESGPYMSVEEVAKVKGVGKAVLENIKATLLDETIQPEEKT